MAKIVVETNDSLKARAKSKAALARMTLTAVIIALLRMWIDGEIKLPLEDAQ